MLLEEIDDFACNPWSHIGLVVEHAGKNIHEIDQKALLVDVAHRTQLHATLYKWCRYFL